MKNKLKYIDNALKGININEINDYLIKLKQGERILLLPSNIDKYKIRIIYYDKQRNVYVLMYKENIENSIWKTTPCLEQIIIQFLINSNFILIDEQSIKIITEVYDVHKSI